MSLERLWAGWRGEYVGSVTPSEVADDCVLCRVVADPDSIVWKGKGVAVIANAFPYTSGHLMVLPMRHVGELEDLEADEAHELWATVTDAVRALKAAYRPEGINLGANLGRAAGAGVPGHFHLHGLPRWNGDTNFTTTVAETRVLPEALTVTIEKLRANWPR